MLLAMDASENADRRIDRMRGCASLGQRLFIVAVSVVLLVIANEIWWSFQDRESINILVTRTRMNDLQAALGRFRAEYGRYPIAGDKDLAARSEGILLLSILGQHEPTNPRKIQFVDLPLANKRGVGGLIDPQGGHLPSASLELRDSWGEKYYLILDLDNDHQVTNPAATAPVSARWLAKHPQPATLKTSVAIYSSGPDRDPATWEDNITSWR